jgi:outer membrane lipoprotein-sorting protein
MVERLLVACALAAAPGDVPPELSALARHLAATTEISAHFAQRRTLAALKDTLQSSGTFSWRRGGKLDWHTTAPSESEMLLDESSAVMKYPALGVEQSIDLASDPQLAAVFQSILAVLRADLKRLEPLYELSVVQRAPLWVDLVPRSKQVAAVVQRIHLKFDAKLNLSEVTLDEAGGDTTDIAFRDQVVREASP